MRSLTLGVLLLAFALRLYHLAGQSIWWDEGHSILMASAPIAEIPTLPGMDVHPPGYFVVLHQWLALTGQSEFALRYLSVLFSVATVALALRFGRALRSGRTGFRISLLAGLFTATSPLYVAYAQEVRMYAMVTFWALASVYLQWRLLAGSNNQRGAERRRLWLGYIAVTALSFDTHYFTIFLLLFENLVWLVWVWRGSSLAKLRGARARGWLGSQAGVVVLISPQLFIALRQITTYVNPNLTPPALNYFLSRSWQAYTVGLTIRPDLARWGMAGAALALALALIPLLGRRLVETSQSAGPGGRPGRIDLPLVFFSGWLVLPLGAYFLVLQHQPSFEPRYMMLITPALFLMLAFGLAMLGAAGLGRQPLRTALAWLGGLSMLLTFALGLRSYFTNVDFFKDDSAGVAAWLATETTPHDLVLVDVPHPFHYYTARGDIPAPTEYLFVDVHTAARLLTEKTRGRNRLFWVTWPRGDTDPRGVIPFLAEKQGEQSGHVAFRGYNLDWYRLSGQPFSLPDELEPTSIAFGDPPAAVLRLDGLAYGGHPSEGQTVSPGQKAWATMHFTLLRETNIDYRVSVRLRSETGRTVAQVDKDLLNDRHFRTSAWPQDDPRLNQAINVYTLPLAPGAEAGRYTLEVVVYDSATLAALPVADVSVRGDDPGSAQVGRLMIVP